MPRGGEERDGAGRRWVVVDGGGDVFGYTMLRMFSMDPQRSTLAAVTAATAATVRTNR